ncbi:hypothetical protein AWJ14_00460 [Hoeflea olei]|uniref:Uncharacterized protein n=2 Tax=Hoeflea olei TaxID=1480615 RepID=A0A1C1YZ35_9HYPH|nr:hypothetical protein AWJ14_00460 [Hoeflea olei]
MTGLMAGILAFLPATSHAADANDIDLKLFGDDVTDGWEGCRLAFWQQDRDPTEDRYAYVFFAPIPDGEALPAWVKIGDEVTDVSPVDIGSAETGMLEPFRLYRGQDGSLTVMMEIFEQARSDRGIEVSSGRLTFLESDKFPFAVRVKGLNGCPAGMESADGDSAGDGLGLTLGAERQLDGLDQIPAAVMKAVAEYGSLCDPQSTAGYSSAYPVSDDITLWQVPCNLFASSASSVFVASYASAPDVAQVLSFPREPGSTEADMIEIVDAVVTPQSATVESASLDSGGDCGTYARHQLVAAPGEVVEFELREFRAKAVCDGVATEPAEFPLVYESR